MIEDVEIATRFARAELGAKQVAIDAPGDGTAAGLGRRQRLVRRGARRRERPRADVRVGGGSRAPARDVADSLPRARRRRVTRGRVGFEAMRVLFLGGTGNISTACVEQALALGHQVGILTRGQRPSPFAEAVEAVLGDRDDASSLGKAAEGRWDVVVDFLAYRPEQVDMATAAFAGRTGQYVFIGTAAAYDKPNARLPLTEDAPLANPFWEYARRKIACEERVVRAHQRPGAPDHDRAALLHLRPDLDPLGLRRPGLHDRGPDAPRPPGPLPRRRHGTLGHDAQQRFRGGPRRAARVRGGSRRGVPRHDRRAPQLGRDLRGDRAGGRRGGEARARAERAHRRARAGSRRGAPRRQGPQQHLRQLEGAQARAGVPAAGEIRRRGSPARSPGSTRTRRGGR